MRQRLAAALGLAILGAASVAQAAPDTNSAAPPAINTEKGDSRTPAAPVTGRNSFTAGEAKQRLEDHGYSDVRDLKQDSNSIWRGRAMRDGKPVSVSLDYQGNIVTR